MRADLLRLIARDELFVDLESQRLWDGSAQVFLDEAAALSAPPASEPFATFGVRPPPPLTMTVGRRIHWSGDDWAIEVVGGGELWLRNVRDETRDLVPLSVRQAERLAHEGKIRGLEQDLIADVKAAALAEWNSAAPTDREKAQLRYDAIRPILAGGPLPAQCRRTLQRWRDNYRRAEQHRGHGLLGLIPRWSHDGRPVTTPVEKLINEVIEEVYMTPIGKSFKATYGVLATRAAAAMLPVPHARTLRRYLALRQANDVMRRRAGSAVSYQSEPFIWHLEPDSPVNGGWPWHVAHLDHTLCDIELVSSKTGENLGRPWLSVLQDAYSRRVLAMWLTFDPPSYRSCLMILRLCVAKHGRLPQVLVVDQGPEFGSTYFEEALAWYMVEKRERPVRQPRHGAVLERLLGVTTQQLVHNMAGNTKLTRNIRQMTREVDPRRHAKFDLATLHQVLAEYFSDVYEHEVHRSLRATPAAVYEQGLERSPQVPVAHIPYTADFVVSLLPTTATGKAKVDPNQGVTVNYLAYWCDAFAGGGIARSHVPVRYDPFDLSYVLAYVQGRWHRCVPSSIPGGWPRTEREMLTASSEIRAEFKQLDHRSRISAVSLAQHLARAEATAAAAAQRRRDQEVDTLVESLDLRLPGIEGNALDRGDDDRLDTVGGEPRAPIDQRDAVRAGSRPDDDDEDWDWRSLGLPDDWTPYE
jgi:putative transposase